MKLSYIHSFSSPASSFQTFMGLQDPLENTLYLNIHLFVSWFPYFSMDFNQICISNSPMYALPVKQLSAKNKHLNVYKKYSNYNT